MDTLEDLKNRRAGNDAKIATLQKDIETFKAENPNCFSNPDLKAELFWLTGERDKLTQANKELTDKIAAIELEKLKLGGAEQILKAVGDLNLKFDGMSEEMKKIRENQMDEKLRSLDIWGDGTSQGSSQNSRKSQSNEPFKNSLIHYYARNAGYHETITTNSGGVAQLISCMVLNKPLNSGKVTAAHIWKHSEATKLPLLGLTPSDIDDPRNGLLLTKSIEAAFDKKEVCFLYHPFEKKFRFRVLNPALLTLRIYYPDNGNPDDYDYPDTFGNFNGQPLQLPEGIFPYKRLLGFHARCAFTKALHIWITKKEYDDYLYLEGLATKAEGRSPWGSDDAKDPLDLFRSVPFAPQNK